MSRGDGHSGREEGSLSWCLLSIGLRLLLLLQTCSSARTSVRPVIGHLRAAVFADRQQRQGRDGHLCFSSCRPRARRRRTIPPAADVEPGSSPTAAPARAPMGPPALGSPVRQCVRKVGHPPRRMTDPGARRRRAPSSRAGGDVTAKTGPAYTVRAGIGAAPDGRLRHVVRTGAGIGAAGVPAAGDRRLCHRPGCHAPAQPTRNGGHG